MQKKITPLSSTHANDNFEADFLTKSKPSKKTIKNILNFAASYRVEKFDKEHYVEYVLN